MSDPHKRCKEDYDECVRRRWDLESELAAAKAETKRLREALANFSKMRNSVDDTYNGGYHEDDTNHAFHHGMMTVFNVYDAFAQAALDGRKACVVRHAIHLRCENCDD